jgi:hypothetical protein
MRKFMIAAVLAALAAAPAMAKPNKQAEPAAAGELILFQNKGFQGDYYTIDADRTTVRTAWNIRSIAIHSGEKWQICAKSRYRECIELNQSLPDASMVGIMGQIGSARRIAASQ